MAKKNTMKLDAIKEKIDNLKNEKNVMAAMKWTNWKKNENSRVSPMLLIFYIFHRKELI